MALSFNQNENHTHLYLLGRHIGGVDMCQITRTNEEKTEIYPFYNVHFACLPCGVRAKLANKRNSNKKIINFF